MRFPMVLGMLAAAAMAAPNPGVPNQMVVTVRPGNRPASLSPGDLMVREGKASAPVVGLQRLPGDLADMQLFILLDDSTRSSSLGLQIPELRTFIESLPAPTQVAVGYMQHGSFALSQAFTTDRQKAAAALRLPASMAGENGSPYFALSDLVKHWPSKERAGRRAVLMLTDGVDRYYGAADMDDPYVDAAVHDALQAGVMVYSIYLRGAGLYGRNSWVTNFAQSRLIEVSQETGGYAYFQDLADPVSVSPFLKDLKDRLENQYLLTFRALGGKGYRPVSLRTEMPGLHVEGPTLVYAQ